jgi:hypothetical protein
MEKYNELVEKYKKFKNFPEREKTLQICLIACNMDIPKFPLIKNTYKIRKYVCNNHAAYISCVISPSYNNYRDCIKNDCRSFYLMNYDSKYLKKAKNISYLEAFKINMELFAHIKYMLEDNYDIILKKNLSYYIY